MAKWMKWGLAIVLPLVGALGAAYVFFVLAGDAPASCGFRLDAIAIREVAASIPGPRPSEIRFERVVTALLPEAALGTGGGWSQTSLPVFAYQLVFGDRTIVVDSAMTEAQAHQSHTRDYDATAWSHVANAMDAADAIYVTHEHTDHLGGLAARLSDGRIGARTHLTRAQLEHPERLGPASIPATVFGRLTPLEVNRLRAVAPGVVLIAAPGHTPGSQMVYVQLANGTEVLLTGDTAWRMSNIERVSGPPRFVTYLGLHNDRHANACQLAELRALSRAHPEVNLVPGHDGPRMDALVASGTLTRGFRMGNDISTQ